MADYYFASRIITTAMGGDQKAQDDPLALWCGIFALVDWKRRGSPSSPDKPEAKG
jgi:hypothetical protein